MTLGSNRPVEWHGRVRAGGGGESPAGPHRRCAPAGCRGGCVPSVRPGRGGGRSESSSWSAGSRRRPGTLPPHFWVKASARGRATASASSPGTASPRVVQFQGRLDGAASTATATGNGSSGSAPSASRSPSRARVPDFPRFLDGRRMLGAVHAGAYGPEPNPTGAGLARLSAGGTLHKPGGTK